MKTRDEIQKEVKEKYLKTNPHRASFVLSTGLGKSKIIVDIVRELKPTRTLILVNSTNLRDDTWKDEFKKWGMEEYYHNQVTTQTYQGLNRSKLTQEHMAGIFVIADEVDFAISNKYGGFLTKFPFTKMLGITGFVQKEKRHVLDLHLPIIAEFTSKEAQSNRTLNRLHFIFVKYELGTNKDIKVEYTKGKEKKYFYTSENDAYIYAADKLANLFILKGKMSADEDSSKIDKQIEFALFGRNAALMNLNTSAMLAKKIMNEEAVNPKNKIISFSTYTKQAAKICKNVYNGAESTTKNEKVFSNFNSSKIRTLAVNSKIDRGATIEGLNILIFESFFGGETAMNQRLGRGLRLPVDEVTGVFVFLPYYRRENKKTGEFELHETSQVKWARKALKNVDTSSNEVIDKRFI